MKVLIVATSLPPGGRERQIIELVKGLKKNNIYFVIASFSRINTVPGIEKAADRLFVFDKKKGYVRCFIDYLTFIYKYRPDIVHSWDHLSTLMTIIAKLYTHVKILDGSIRGSFAYKRRKIFLYLSRPFTERVVANSVAGLESANISVSDKNVVVYNGIDLNRFYQNENNSNKVKNYFPTGKVVGMVANIRPQKDYRTFILVAKKVIQKCDDVIFVSIGNGCLNDPFYSSLDDFVKKKLIFLGGKSNIENIVREFDIGLLLTDDRYHKEGISNSIMEYMACEKPVIATDSGGTPEILQDGISGYLAPPFDVDYITEKVLFLLENEDIRYDMGKAGRKIIEEKFEIDIMTKKYIKMYYEMLDIC